MSKIAISTVQMIKLRDWDRLVRETYGRPYSLQQQEGCRDKGMLSITVPTAADDFERDEVPEIVNGPLMGVSFKAWLARDPKKPLPGREDSFGLGLWWGRNFYPDVDVIANDLYAKGLLDAGTYEIEIDW